MPLSDGLVGDQVLGRASLSEFMKARFLGC
jgi:hypothetical protein